MHRDRTWHRHHIVWLSFLLFAIPSQKSFALEVLADNLAQTFEGFVNIENSVFVSQSFTTSSAGSTLTEVSVRLFNGSGTTGLFELQIWNSSGLDGRPGGQVGAAIHSGLAENLNTTAPGALTVTGLNVALEANRTYYIVARGVTLTEVNVGVDLLPGYLSWSSTPSNGGIGFPAAKWDSADSGSNWTGPVVGFNYGMRIVAVPEPGTWVQAGVGCIFLALASRRRWNMGRKKLGESE